MSKTVPSIDLRPDHWIIVRDILKRYVPNRKIVVFGSRASRTGASSPGAKLDGIFTFLIHFPLSINALTSR